MRALRFPRGRAREALPLEPFTALYQRVTLSGSPDPADHSGRAAARPPSTARQPNEDNMPAPRHRIPLTGIGIRLITTVSMTVSRHRIYHRSAIRDTQLSHRIPPGIPWRVGTSLRLASPRAHSAFGPGRQPARPLYYHVLPYYFVNSQ